MPRDSRQQHPLGLGKAEGLDPAVEVPAQESGNIAKHEAKRMPRRMQAVRWSRHNGLPAYNVREYYVRAYYV